jgi:integrase
MRQGELFALVWSDIDFEAGSVLVQRSLEEIDGKHRVKEPKSGRGRRIDVSSFALAALQEHRKAMLAEGNYQPEAPVFCAPRGRVAAQAQLPAARVSALAKSGEPPRDPLPRLAAHSGHARAAQRRERQW